MNAGQLKLQLTSLLETGKLQSIVVSSEEEKSKKNVSDTLD